MGKVTDSATKKAIKTTARSAPSSTLHPPYIQMISEAISALKDRTGSSQPAIAKFIEEKYKNVLPPNFRKMLSVQLKHFVTSERLVKVKNSYKISSAEKLKLAVKETQKKKEINNTNDKKRKRSDVLSPKEKAVKKVTAKSRRLSQIKTSDGLEKNNKLAEKKSISVAKTKRLSQVKTPEGLKKKKNLTPMKRKNLNTEKASRPVKKARK